MSGLISGVLLDVGGTLHQSSTRGALAADVIRTALASRAVATARWSDDELRRAYKQSHLEVRRGYAESGVRRRGAELVAVDREHHAGVLRLLGVPTDEASVDALAAEWERREPIVRYVPGAREAVRSLAARGIALGIVSNTFRDHRRSLARDGLLPAFRVIVLSIEVGLWKPDPAIFALACRELGLPPGRVVHIGDKDTADIEPARAAGLRAIRIDGEVGFAPVLRELEPLLGP